MKRLLLLLSVFGLSCCATAQEYASLRPAPESRLFRSQAVEAKIEAVSAQLSHQAKVSVHDIEVIALKEHV